MTRRRSHFGKHHEDVWRRLAAQVGGELERKGTWQADKVRIDADDWSITLDVHTIPGFKSEEHFTRFRASVVNTEGVRFVVYRKTVSTRIAAVLGMDHVETGYPMFDNDFIVRANDRQRIKDLLSIEAIRILMEAQRDFCLRLDRAEESDGGQHTDAEDELCLEVRDVIHDLDRLKQCYELFALVLAALCDSQDTHIKTNA